MSCGLIPTFLLYMFPTAHSLRLTLSLCLSLFLSPLNCHHLVLRPLSNCPRPLIVLIMWCILHGCAVFPSRGCFFQSHSFVSFVAKQTKRSLLGKFSIYGPWPLLVMRVREKETLTKPALAWNMLYASMWIQMHHIATRGTIANFSINSSSTVFFFRSTNVINIWTG